MTEQEFKKQVWRAYDTVDIEGVANHARVIAVGFPSLSVRAAVAPGVVEWFKCDQIVAHHSATGNPDDLAIIEDLHNKLMAANKRNEDLQQILNTQQERIKELKDKADGKAEPSAVLDREINRLFLSVRAQNIITKLGIKTYGELLKFGREPLLKLRNMGVTTISVFDAEMERVGLWNQWKYNQPINV